MQKLIYRNPNGEEIDFTSGDFGVTKWKGFSKVDMEVQSQQVPFHDGSVFLDALLGERELSVTVAVNDDGDLEKRYRLKRELIHCLNPKLGEGELIYTNDYTSKMIVCVPDIPEFDNKNMNDSGTMKAMCSFTASDPYWEDVEENIITFSLYDNIAVNNDGDIPCPVKIELSGQNIQNPLLRNITTKKEVALSGNYTGTVSYNFGFGKKEIKYGSLIQEVNILKGISLFNSSIAEGNGIIVVSGVTTYYSEDGYNYNIIDNLAETGDYDVSLLFVYYSSHYSCFFGTKLSGGVYKSNDGKKWEIISDDTVNIIVGAGSVLIGISRTGSSEIKKSVDAGVTWTSAYTGEENIVSIAASNNVIIAVTVSYLYSSSDFGQTWTQTTLPHEGGKKIIWNSESNAFYLSCVSTTYRSTDGNSWTQILEDTMWSLFFKPNNEKLYLICFSDNQRPIYSSSDMGETWELAGNNAFATDARWSVCAGRAIAVVGSEVINENELRLSYNMFDYDRISFPRTTFLAVAEDKKIILSGNYYYQNGKWSLTNLPSGLTITSCCYGKGIFLVSLSGYNIRRICYGTDCQTWTLSSIPNDMSGGIKYSERLSKFFCSKYSSLDGINWTMTTEENITKIIAVIDTPNNTWLYGVSEHYIRKSSDGITWANTGIYSYSPNICYCDKQNLVYIVDKNSENNIYVNNPETNVYTPRNFISGERLSYLAWSNEKNMFIGSGGIIGGGNTYSKIYSYMSFDGINWQRIPSSVISDYVYVKFLGDFIGNNSTVIKFVGEENIINSLSEDSTMNFELENGGNQFRWSTVAGDGIGIISYRQKYLGV